MKKIDKAIWKETRFIAIWTLIFSMLMQAVFLLIDWDYTVLLGNLISAVAGILNFFILGVTVQKGIECKDEKQQQNIMKISKALRMIFMLVVLIIGVVFVNVWATIIPVVFPRIAILIRPLFDKKQGKQEPEGETGDGNELSNKEGDEAGQVAESEQAETEPTETSDTPKEAVAPNSIEEGDDGGEKG